MAQQQNPYYGTGFYQPSGTYVQPQQMTPQQQQQQQAMQQTSCATAAHENAKAFHDKCENMTTTNGNRGTPKLK